MEPVCMFPRDKLSTLPSSTTAQSSTRLISMRPRWQRMSPIAPSVPESRLTPLRPACRNRANTQSSITACQVVTKCHQQDKMQ